MLIRSIRRGIQRCGQSRRWLQWIPELIAGIYALASVAWIVLSDEVLISLAGDYHTYQHLQTYKGTVFVVGSALLIYGLLRVAMRQLHRSYQTVEASEARLQLALQNVNGGVWKLPWRRRVLCCRSSRQPSSTNLICPTVMRQPSPTGRPASTPTIASRFWRRCRRRCRRGPVARRFTAAIAS